MHFPSLYSIQSVNFQISNHSMPTDVDQLLGGYCTLQSHWLYDSSEMAVGTGMEFDNWIYIPMANGPQARRPGSRRRKKRNTRAEKAPESERLAGYEEERKVGGGNGRIYRGGLAGRQVGFPRR